MGERYKCEGNVQVLGTSCGCDGGKGRLKRYSRISKKANLRKIKQMKSVLYEGKVFNVGKAFEGIIKNCLFTT